MTPVIQTSTLTRSFGANTAVQSLTLEVDQGEVFGFLGHNGAGKTTTIRLLNGVLAPSGGSAEVLGFSPHTDGPSIRQRTGVLTETPALDERLSARDNLSIYADLFNVPPAAKRQRVEDLLQQFDLSDRAREKVGGYSKGMKQRMALARALLHDPELLFLDEPTAGLDPVAARQVHDLILHLSRDEGRTIFLCTHNLPEAQRLCDRVGVMEHGRLIAVGKTSELAQAAGLSVRLEIDVAQDDASRADALLREMFPQIKVSFTAGQLFLTGTRYESIPGLIAVLAGAGIRLYRVSPQEATLEDIYFALHEKEAAS
ncbi:MAG: ABC transporter ATP-binding protein [Anaerolineae bacterium]|nr:ABC transporter ATP-binding protein [Anaerolineae bacterium]